MYFPILNISEKTPIIKMAIIMYCAFLMKAVHKLYTV